jgi:23S rRNA-/tRNA-specific pseudouridylate synthase
VAWEARVVEAAIGRDGERRPAWNVTEGGARAETRLRVLERGAEWTLVEAEPVTGRTNQIRIHCAWIGAPIRGDEAYGGAAGERLYLHAAQLAFLRPDGVRVEIAAGRPAGFSVE